MQKGKVEASGLKILKLVQLPQLDPSPDLSLQITSDNKLFELCCGLKYKKDFLGGGFSAYQQIYFFINSVFIYLLIH